MRTTLDLDAGLLAAARRQAVERGTTLSRIVEDALRAAVIQPAPEQKRMALPTFRGSGTRQGVDLLDSNHLRDVMDAE